MSRLKKELKLTRSFESAEQEAFLNLQRTASQLAGPFEAMLKKQNLSTSLYNVLRILRGQAGQGLACSHIGERMVTRVPDITRLVDKLIRMGLVQRERSAADRRVVLITIRQQGLDLLARLDRPLAELHRKTLGHLASGELKEFNNLLVKARTTA